MDGTSVKKRPAGDSDRAEGVALFFIGGLFFCPLAIIRAFIGSWFILDPLTELPPLRQPRRDVFIGTTNASQHLFSKCPRSTQLIFLEPAIHGPKEVLARERIKKMSPSASLGTTFIKVPFEGFHHFVLTDQLTLPVVADRLSDAIKAMPFIQFIRKKVPFLSPFITETGSKIMETLPIGTQRRSCRLIISNPVPGRFKGQTIRTQINLVFHGFADDVRVDQVVFNLFALPTPTKVDRLIP
ncbi:MAG: hypothetical protein HQL76_12015 [Magnetococcales bacterium]|nr:hypothetical protein [Magnetococcales bacterium]